MISPKMFPFGFHPVVQRQYQPGDILTSTARLDFAPCLPRTAHPPTYYYYDFNISKRAVDNGTNTITLEGEYGSIRSAPEMMGGEAHDAYANDVYCLGTTIDELVTGVRFSSILSFSLLTSGQKYQEMKFLKKWVDRLRMGVRSGAGQETRYNAQEALSSFNEILYEQTDETLRTRLPFDKDDGWQLDRTYFRQLFFNLGAKRMYEELFYGVPISALRLRYGWLGLWMDTWRAARREESLPR
jgi:hypothetical protein